MDQFAWNEEGMSVSIRVSVFTIPTQSSLCELCKGLSHGHREGKPFLVALQKSHPRKESIYSRELELHCFRAVPPFEPADHDCALRKAKILL